MRKLKFNFFCSYFNTYILLQLLPLFETDIRGCIVGMDDKVVELVVGPTDMLSVKCTAKCNNMLQMMRKL